MLLFEKNAERMNVHSGTAKGKIYLALVVKLSEYTCDASSGSPNMWRTEL